MSNQRGFLLQISAVVMLLTWWVVPVYSADQDSSEPPSEPTPDEVTTTSKGSWNILPQVIVSQIYDDNIFATRNFQVDDDITVISPSLLATSNWEKHALRFEAGSDVVRYASNTRENHEHYRLSGEGRYDLTTSSNVFGGLLFRQDVEDRESADDVFGTEPTQYYDNRAYAGYFRQFARASMRIGATANQLDFENVDGFFGPINNDDRDRNNYTGGIRLGYAVKSGLEAYMQAAFDVRDYDASVDDNNLDRDSDGYRLLLGVKRDKPGSYNAGIYIGHMNQDYDDYLLQDVSKPTFGANFTWYPSLLTSFNAYMDRTLEETTLNFTSGYLYTRSGISINHQPTRDLTLNTFITYGESDYQGTDREDELTTAGASIKYFVSNRIYVQGEYQFRHNESSLNTENYDRNQIFLRLGAYLYEVNRPRHRSRAVDSEFLDDITSAGSFDGFYAGLMEVFGNLNTNLTGPRGASDTLKADFGDNGTDWGVFAGYGRSIDRWYLGLEADTEQSDTNWSSVNTGSRSFSVDKDKSYGLSARLGYLLKYGSMVYARAGAVHTDFNTMYNDGVTFIDQSDSDTAGRFGFGVDAPVSSNLFLRVDYTYTDYDDIDIAYTATSTDTFENSENLFRVGLAYQFGGGLPATTAYIYPVENLGGFYAGTQVGYGSLNSEVDGLRAANPYSADSGDDGSSWGVFGGYGVVLNSFYVGLELDANGGNADWQFNRGLPRSYSVEKSFSYGASARAGYILANGALIYGRVGAVRADFVTRYSQSGNFADVNNTESGTSFGGGVEIPATESLSIRFDYTRTNYGDYDVNYVSGVDTFDNSEDQFKLGVLFHF